MKHFNIEQWTEVCESFEEFFDDVEGDVERSEDALRFISPLDLVQTSLFLYRSGNFAAAMPLHGIDAKVEHIHFKPEAFEIQLLGEGVDYTYKVPPELVKGD